LKLANGATLEIPAGALDSSVSLTFSQGRATSVFANNEYERALGPTLNLSPSVALSAPLKVSIPLDALPEGFDGGELTLATEVPDGQQGRGVHAMVQTRWDYLPAVTEGGRAQASMDSAAGMRLQFVVSRED